MNTPTYKGYAALFGQEQADAIVAAAEGHANEIEAENRGSDPFRWAITIVIGYDCVKSYAADHNITVPFWVFKTWVYLFGGLRHHDGDYDYIAMFCGVYDQYIPGLVTQLLAKRIWKAIKAGIK